MKAKTVFLLVICSVIFAGCAAPEPSKRVARSERGSICASSTVFQCEVVSPESRKERQSIAE